MTGPCKQADFEIARLTADSIDMALLRKIAIPPVGANLGSLKLLEHALAKVAGADAARSCLTPLVGIYELRLGDAHLPSSRIKEAYKLVQIDTTARPYDQAVKLLDQTVGSLRAVLTMLD